MTEPTATTDSISKPELKRRFDGRQLLSRVVFLLITLGITILIGIFATQINIEQFRRYGYLGVFLASVIAQATIALPVPGLAVTIGMAAALPHEWWLVGLVAGVGEALGETTAYLAGYGGSAIIENQQMYERIKGWMEHHGMMTIFVLAVIPNPVIDLAGICAGVSKYAFHKFIFALWAGKSIKTLIYAWAGANSVNWLLQYFMS